MLVPLPSIQTPDLDTATQAPRRLQALRPLKPHRSPCSRQVLPGGLRRARLAPTVQGRQMGLGRTGEGHTGLSSVPTPPGLPEDALPPQMPAPGMGGHLHFTGQLEQGNVITIELQDSLVLLGIDVELRGDHHLLDLDVFAPLGAGIPWEQ